VIFFSKKAMAHQCIHCSATIATDDINVASDIALCRACGKSMPFSSLASIPGADAVDLTRPPKGVSLEDDVFYGKVLGYRKRSPMVFFLIPFMLVWSGISLGGIYGSQIASGEFDPAASLFGIPFLIGTVVMLVFIVFMLFGRTRIWFHRGICHIFMGVGKLGWTRRHECTPETQVAIRMSNVRVNNQPKPGIELKTGERKTMFGTMWSEDAQAFIATAMRRALQAGRPR
jgi:hypothetical protein